MKKSTGAVIGVIVVIAIILVAGFGFVPGIPAFLEDYFPSITNILNPNPIPENASSLGFSDRDIFFVIQIMAGKSLNWIEVSPYIDSLNMELYGINDQTAYEVHQWYSAQNIGEGYTSLGANESHFLDIDVYSEAWSNGVFGRSVQTADGLLIRSACDCDTAILSTNGLLTDYYDLLTIIRNT